MNPIDRWITRHPHITDTLALITLTAFTVLIGILIGATLS